MECTYYFVTVFEVVYQMSFIYFHGSIFTIFIGFVAYIKGDEIGKVWFPCRDLVRSVTLSNFKAKTKGGMKNDGHLLDATPPIEKVSKEKEQFATIMSEKINERLI